jgi:integrase
MIARVDVAWTEAKLERITHYECRHTFITTMIAACTTAKVVSTLAGHASINITFDRYGHLPPGSEEEAGAKLDALYCAAG